MNARVYVCNVCMHVRNVCDIVCACAHVACMRACNICYIYACMYACSCVYMCACVALARASMFVCVHVCVHLCYACVCMHLFSHRSIAYMASCIYAMYKYVHIYIYMYVYIYIFARDTSRNV